MTDAVAEFALSRPFVRSFDEKWFIPCWPSGFMAATQVPGEETIQSQVTARLQAGTDADLFDIRDFAVLGKEERMEGVYLVKVSYQLHFKQGLDQLQVLHDEDPSMTGSAPSSRRWG